MKIGINALLAETHSLSLGSPTVAIINESRVYSTYSTNGVPPLRLWRARGVRNTPVTKHRKGCIRSAWGNQTEIREQKEVIFTRSRGVPGGSHFIFLHICARANKKEASKNLFK